MRMYAVFWSVLACLQFLPAAFAYTLFNGAEIALFNGASQNCLTALNATLSCPLQSDYAALCTPACKSSLQKLASSGASACPSFSTAFNGGTISVGQILDYYNFKFNITCLTDTATGGYCELVQQTWNIPQLNASGKATWPTYTNKSYPNWYWNSDGSPLEDPDGNLIPDPFEPNFFVTNALNGTTVGTNAKDFYVNQSAYTSNYGLSLGDSSYDVDELPLQYQCSSCSVNRYIMGYQSKWGNIFDEVAVQIWTNIQKNCKLTQTLVPAYNMSGAGRQTTLGPIQWTTQTCPRNITVQPNTNNTCASLGQQFSFESASLSNLNNVACSKVYNGSYCAAPSCSIAVIPKAMSLSQFLTTSNYPNITLTQLSIWNPYTISGYLQPNDTVCIGPPGGAYIPPTTTAAQAYPTVYTTTASPAASTPAGTIKNCGKYYLIRSGDYCNSVALNNSITFQSLLNMNPSINCGCTNLYLNYDYCVGAVNGTTVANVTCSAGSSTTTSATTTKSAVSSCTSTAAAPTQTVSGTTSKCCTWYTTVSGDSCYTIEQKYGISLAQFRSWNTYIDAACDNLFLGYAYCVFSSDPVVA